MEFMTGPVGEVCAPPATIAIDGPAASGKTSVGEALAAALGYLFLDTGLMYRAFTLAALRSGTDAADSAACTRLAASLPLTVRADGRTRIFLGAEDVTPELRGETVEANVSSYSAIPGVREAMVRLQREVAVNGKAILAGRDIGTVVLPGAPLKLFLVASEEARAARRTAQAVSWGERRDADSVLRDIAGRDRQDSARAASPLVPAADAIVIDTTAMTLEEVIAAAMEHIQCDIA